MKYLLICVLSFVSCITIAPQRTVEDHYGDQRILLGSGTLRIKYIELDPNILKQYNPKNIYLFATWCPHCVIKLKNTNIKCSNNDLMLVSANYDINRIEHFASSYIDTVFILSNSHYGSIEKEKVLKFSEELTNQKDTIYGLPKIFELKSDRLYHLRWDN